MKLISQSVKYQRMKLKKINLYIYIKLNSSYKSMDPWTFSCIDDYIIEFN